MEEQVDREMKCLKYGDEEVEKNTDRDAKNQRNRLIERERVSEKERWRKEDWREKGREQTERWRKGWKN